jgi:hypothetical protein
VNSIYDTEEAFEIVLIDIAYTFIRLIPFFAAAI